MIKTRRIGLAVDAVGTYGRGIIRGVAGFCRTHPHWIITEEPKWSFANRSSLDQWEVDGIIAQVFDKKFESELLARGIPVTNVSNFTEDHELVSVLPDDDAVGVMAAQYLASLGIREFGFLWGGHSEFARLREQGFTRHLTVMNMRVHECNAAKQDMAEWLLHLPKPAAILGCNDEWAHRLLKAARRVDVRVPDQVAVLGVDDDELLNTLMTPSLSSISMPLEQIGHEAAALLEQMMDGHAPKEKTFRFAPLRVVTRQSTEMLFVDDGDVQLALRFIRDHAGEPLRVDDVRDHVPLSRRSLERRFREALGRSISEEIRHAHVERAKQLLITTDIPIKQIATHAGFENTTRMGIVFQKEVGESPSAYRMRSRMGGRPKAAADDAVGGPSAGTPSVPATPSGAITGKPRA